MFRKSGNKDIVYETVNNVAMAAEIQPRPEHLKEKIAKVRDVYPFKTEQEVHLVLQYYDYDENVVIDAYTRDGATEALKSWSHTGNNTKTKNNKNKKKNKKKNKRENNLQEKKETAVDDEEDSCSQSADFEINKVSDVKDDICVNGKVQTTELEQATLVNDSENQVDKSSQMPISSSDKKESYSGIQELKCHEPSSAQLPSVTVPTTSSPTAIMSSTSQTAVSQEKLEKPLHSEDFHHSSQKDNGSKYQPRQRVHSSYYPSRSRNPSVTEDSTTNQVNASTNIQTKRGLEKSLKDLNRQTVALQRIENNLEQEIEKSYKRIKNAFQEIQKLLEEKQNQIEDEMDKVKIEARELLTQRQELAVELKQRANRASTMSESEWNELRADIKQFVVERKYDEELGKTPFFVWNKDKETELINSIGEVNHVKNNYSQRRHSVSSATSSLNPESSLASASVRSESISSLPDKSDVQTSATNPVSSHSFVSNDNVHFPVQSSQGESRPRVFSNRQWQGSHRGGGYQNNKFSGRYNRGGGQWRGGYVRYRQDYGASGMEDRRENSNIISTEADRKVISHPRDRGQNPQRHHSPYRNRRFKNSNMASSRSGGEPSMSKINSSDNINGERNVSKEKSNRTEINGYDH